MFRTQRGAAFARSLAAPPSTSKFVLCIHGGAGAFREQDMTPDEALGYRRALHHALQQGYQQLCSGGTSIDAVQAAIAALEDSPLFNAGKGAVLTGTGSVELDAAIMDGRSGRAGAVAGLMHVANPIALARLVMERSPHVMLAGDGAEAFAKAQGIPTVTQDYFVTDRQRAAWEQAHRTDGAGVAAAKYGTVGAVALDSYGDLAAGTSTGGIANKLPGRIGDSPIIGAGTYANNASCAVSATGHGEYFIRNVVAHDIAARMRYRSDPLAAAATDVVMEKLAAQGGEGGVIAVDAEGNIAMPFNSAGMYRGWVDWRGRMAVAIGPDWGGPGPSA